MPSVVFLLFVDIKKGNSIFSAKKPMAFINTKLVVIDT